MMPLKRFVAIDWSGAKARRPRGIEVAEIEWDCPNPRLVPCPNGRRWSRYDVAEFIVGLAGKSVLVGVDFAFSVPWKETCGRPSQVSDAKELWALVEKLCLEVPHMYAGPIWTSPLSPFRQYIFHHQSDHRGNCYYRKNLRDVEKLTKDAFSIYHMAGAQVGAGSFAGMRMLHGIVQSFSSKIAIWPFDEFDCAKTTVVEIYPSFFYQQAGSRRPSKDELGQGRFEQIEKTLKYYGCKQIEEMPCRSVDQADALISAAALKAVAVEKSFKFSNNHSFDHREGWIFGVPSGH